MVSSAGKSEPMTSKVVLVTGGASRIGQAAQDAVAVAAAG
jgi:NAD(P)-dependent dehydrogenase (short-subunit alcohol dehydrogenase family)